MKSQVNAMLDTMGPPAGGDPAADPDDVTDSEGDQAAGESAVEDFAAALKRSDFKAAYAALKEAVGYCQSGE